MESEKKYRKFRWGRFFLWTGLSLLLVIIGFSVYIGTNANKLINNYLPVYIYEKTDSVYQVQYDTLHVDFWKRSIVVNQLQISPDSSHIRDTLKPYYHFKTKQLILKNLLLKPLISEHKFKADLFSVELPYFSSEKNQNTNLGNLSFPRVQKGDSVQIPLFNEVFFDTIMIIDAELQLDTLVSSIKTFPTINLELNHFKLGGLKYTDTPYPFDVSDISLNVQNLHQNLPDSLHFISVEQINLSLLNSTIKAKNISLEPNTDTLTVENRYRFSMPEMTLQTTQIENLLGRDSLHFDKITLHHPIININFGSKVKKGTPLNEINLHKLVEKTIRQIDVDHFAIENASVDLTPSNSDSVSQIFESLFVNLYSLRSDAASYQQEDRLLSARHLSLALKKFTLKHSDEVHILSINDLKANTRESRVSSGEIEFKPTVHAQKNSVNTLVNIACDGFVFKDVDFLEMYHHQLLPMKELLLKKSSTEITYSRKNPQKKQKDKSLILEKLEDYLQGVYVETTTIQNSTLEYNYSTKEQEKGFFKTAYNFSLEKLSVDSATFFQSDKIFFAENFNLNFSDINLQLADNEHRLMAKEVQLSSEGKSATINDLKIIPTKKDKSQNTSFDIEFPRIKLSGANLHHAFFHKELYIAYLSVSKPVFNIDKQGAWITTSKEKSNPYQNEIYKLMSDYINKLHISKLSMNNGRLNLLQQKTDEPDFELSNLFSVNLTNFEIDKDAHLKEDKLFFSDDIDLVLKDYAFTLADGVHKVQAEEIGILSSENRVYVKTGRLYPDILSNKFKELSLSVFANIPDMNILGADIFGLFNKGQLPVSSVKLYKPEIKLMFLETDGSSHTDKKNKPVFLLEELDLFSSKIIEIDQGKLELANYIDHQSKTFISTKVDFNMDHFSATQNNNTFSTDYGNFEIQLADLNYDFDDGIHQLSLNQLDYSLAEKELQIQGATISPHLSQNLNNRDLFVDINIENTMATGFDFNKYLNNKELLFRDIRVTSPVISIKDQRIEKGDSFSPYQLELYEKIKPFANKIVANNIITSRGIFSFKGDKLFENKNIDLKASNFVVDKSGTNKDKLLHSDAVKLNLNNISGKTKDGFFEYSFGDIEINESGDFNVVSIWLKPLIGKKEFALKKKYQDNYFNIDGASLKGHGLNMQALFERGDILMENARINIENVKIHRDKTFPLNPEQRPKLPQQLIRDLKRTLDVRQISLNVNRFEYTELEPGSLIESYIFVDAGNVYVENLSNKAERIKENPNLKSIINGKLMGLGKSQIEMVYNIPSFGNEFTFKALIEELPLSKLNSITEPGLNISIKEGINRKLDVYFEANEDSAVGDMKFAYNDLKISVLNKRGDELREDKFISFLVNSMAVRSDNPKPGRILLPAKFVKHRDKQRSVVGYCWQSIYSGIKVTLGIKEKEEN